MDLLDKFNFALDSLNHERVRETKQEEIVFSSLPRRKAYSISDEEFKVLVDSLEAHFLHIAKPIALKVAFKMANRFSTQVRYREIYALILKNLKQVTGFFLSSFSNRGELEVTLTADQVELKIRNLKLRESEEERALLFRLKNNRFFNVKVGTYKVGRQNLYEVTLTGSWSLLEKTDRNLKRSKDGARKAQWENTL